MIDFILAIFQVTGVLLAASIPAILAVYYLREKMSR